MKESNKEILSTVIGVNLSLVKNNLSVGGSLDLRNTQITELPDSLSVGSSLYLGGTQITELTDSLSVGDCLDLDPRKQTSISAYRENCGNSGRTIYSVFFGGEFKIRADCFFDSFTKFCEAVKRDYSEKQAIKYIEQAQECVNELTKKLNK
jgi:hypothetical protein